MSACFQYAGVTVTNGPSTFHAATGCAPEATICVEVDCKITGTTEAACLETTIAPELMLLPPEVFASAVLTASGDALTARSSTTKSIQIASSDMPYVDVTIVALQTPYAANEDSLNSTATTSTSSGLTMAPSAGSVTDKGTTSATTSGGAAVSSLTDDSGASHNMLGLSGGLAGAVIAGVALL
jgi:hypothetical protein